MSNPDPRHIERRHLLLDDRIIESTENAEIILGSIHKHPDNPLFEEDSTWEKRFDNLYANVIWDEEEQLYKCWYSPFIISHSSKKMTIEQRKEKEYGKHPQEMGICYATSEDGINWNKPKLGLVEYDGNKENNLVWRGEKSEREDISKSYWAGPHGSGIFKDTMDSNSGRRYKAILKYKTLSVAFSKDGLRWGSAIACPEADSHGDTHNNAFWAPTMNRYVAITRNWRKAGDEYIRQVARTSSEDFEKWDKTEFILEGLDSNQQLYAMPVFFHGGIYLGLLAVHDQSIDRVWTELAWSADTITWNRVLPGTPLIGNDGEEGDYDWGCVYAASSPIFLKDEIRLYYGGSDGLHTSWRNGYFCLASLRPDGFAGFKSMQGTVTTRPVYDGRARVSVSADITESGELITRILDSNDVVLAESEPLRESVTDAEIRWKPTERIAIPDSSFARLQFAFRNATVYSFLLQ